MRAPLSAVPAFARRCALLASSFWILLGLNACGHELTGLLGGSSDVLQQQVQIPLRGTPVPDKLPFPDLKFDGGDQKSLKALSDQFGEGVNVEDFLRNNTRMFAPLDQPGVDLDKSDKRTLVFTLKRIAVAQNPPPIVVREVAFYRMPVADDLGMQQDRSGFGRIIAEGDGLFLELSLFRGKDGANLPLQDMIRIGDFNAGAAKPEDRFRVYRPFRFDFRESLIRVPDAIGRLLPNAPRTPPVLIVVSFTGQTRRIETWVTTVEKTLSDLLKRTSQARIMADQGGAPPKPFTPLERRMINVAFASGRYSLQKVAVECANAAPGGGEIIEATPGQWQNMLRRTMLDIEGMILTKYNYRVFAPDQPDGPAVPQDKVGVYRAQVLDYQRSVFLLESPVVTAMRNHADGRPALASIAKDVTARLVGAPLADVSRELGLFDDINELQADFNLYDTNFTGLAGNRDALANTAYVLRLAGTPAALDPIQARTSALVARIRANAEANKKKNVLLRTIIYPASLDKPLADFDTAVSALRKGLASPPPLPPLPPLPPPAAAAPR